MTTDIAKKISESAGVPDLVQLLAEKINGSELSSLLLEVFSRRAAGIGAGSLLQQYRSNSMVQPADTDMIAMLEKELDILRLLRQWQYAPLELSPVGQFGSCSAVGTVSQKKIISAVRHTEVMADATNALALHMADIRQALGGEDAREVLRFCTVHRHIRTMQLKARGFTPHFKIACMVAGGRDTGNLEFERHTLLEQLQAIYQLLTGIFGIKQVRFSLVPRAGYPQGAAFAGALAAHLSGQPFEIKVVDAAAENNYYKGLQFKAYIPAGGQEMEIADGGFVDWTQQLLGNRKERCLISGIGLSLLMKLAYPH